MEYKDEGYPDDGGGGGGGGGGSGGNIPGFVVFMGGGKLGPAGGRSGADGGGCDCCSRMMRFAVSKRVLESISFFSSCCVSLCCSPTKREMLDAMALPEEIKLLSFCFS